METRLIAPKQVEEQEEPKITALPNSDFAAHFKYYPEEALRKSINPILNENLKSSFLFEIEGFGNYHAIFAFKNRKEEDSYSSRPLTMDYNEDILSIKPISNKDQIALGTKVGKLSQAMIECFGDALRFYPWKMIKLPGGFVVDGHNEEEFTMATGGALGIKVSVDVARYLNKTLKEGDNLLTKDTMLFITSSFVHEFAHYEKPLTVSIKSETVSFISEMAYSITNNGCLPSNMIHDVKDLYDDLKESYKGRYKLQKLQRFGIHSKGEYIATVIIAAILSEKNRKIRDKLSSDSTDLKLKALKNIFKNMPLFINDEDKKHLYRRFEDIMIADNTEKCIILEFQTAVEGFGIKNAETFISKNEVSLYGTKRRE